MDEANILFAQNLRQLREERKLSLDRLAELTGVSKSMLGQIERGESSPTIATVWKIAAGLKISFTALLQEPQSQTVVIRHTDIQPLAEDCGRYRLYPLFPIEQERSFEVFSFEIDAGGCLRAEAHTAGTQEFITVFSGELKLTVKDFDYRIAAGDSIRFFADRPHAYCNVGDALVRASLVIEYR